MENLPVIQNALIKVEGYKQDALALFLLKENLVETKEIRDLFFNNKGIDFYPATNNGWSYVMARNYNKGCIFYNFTRKYRFYLYCYYDKKVLKIFNNSLSISTDNVPVFKRKLSKNESFNYDLLSKNWL